MKIDLPTGPLAGLRIVEFAGLGPAPFACMLLSDMGADVLTIDRPGVPVNDGTNITRRGRRTLQVDLKDPGTVEKVLLILERADVLVEGFRPGVMERLSLGPDLVAARNQRLIYARMTGWGQDGPLAPYAGHDINYIAITGALHAIGHAGGPPVPPLNLVGDYGGGSLFLVAGILAAVYEVGKSGKGQIVDASITDGVTSMMTHFVSQHLRGSFREERGTNILDGGAPYYGIYETSDAKHVCIGPMEPAFFSVLCDLLDVNESLRDAQSDRARWPLLRAEFERAFRSRTRDEWTVRLECTDACFSPVLSISEAMKHPHILARRTFINIDGVSQPAPAPRFSRTPSSVQRRNASGLTEIQTVLDAWCDDSGR